MNAGRERWPPLVVRGALALAAAAIAGYLFWVLIPVWFEILTPQFLAPSEKAWWIAITNAALLGGACYATCAVALFVPGPLAYRWARVVALAGWALLLPLIGSCVMCEFSCEYSPPLEARIAWAALALTAALWLPWHGSRTADERA